MTTVLIAITLTLLLGFFAGRNRARSIQATDGVTMRAQPHYHGGLIAITAVFPVLIGSSMALILGPGEIDSAIIGSLPALAESWTEADLNLFLQDIHSLAAGGTIVGEVTPLHETALAAALSEDWSVTLRYIGGSVVIALIAGLLVFGRVSDKLPARDLFEKVIFGILIAFALVAVLTTIGIVLSLIFETLRFFDKVPFFDFLFGLHWSPQTALRADQVGSSGSFGVIPLLTGTLLITFIAMVVAVPIGLYSAVYLSEFAAPNIRATVKPLLEILAGIPTVVYGFFAALTVAPYIASLGASIGLDVAAGSALAAGAVMGMMIIPLVSSLSDDVINAVPQSLRDGAYALGATSAETIRQVVLPAALPGIVGSVLLAVSRAIGETMIVVMAAGLAANLTANPLEMVTTITVQIVTLLVGDQEFDSAKTLAAFALGLFLFVVTLGLNFIALRVVQKYREQYD